MNESMEVGLALMMIVSLLGGLILIGLIILFFVVSAQKSKRIKMQTTQGTDKSPFAKQLMEKYHGERAEKKDDLL